MVGPGEDWQNVKAPAAAAAPVLAHAVPSSSQPAQPASQQQNTHDDHDLYWYYKTL